MILSARLWKPHFVGKSQLAWPCHWKFTECQFKVMWRSRSTTGQGEGDLNSWTIRGRSKNYMENEFQFFTHFFYSFFLMTTTFLGLGWGFMQKKIPGVPGPSLLDTLWLTHTAASAGLTGCYNFEYCVVSLSYKSRVGMCECMASIFARRGLSVCFVFLITHCSDWLIVLNIKTSYRRVTWLHEVARY